MLLLDEPLGALDLKLRKEMQLELKALQREVGITFVYVTHDQEEALTMSDVIVVMRDGRIQQMGGPTDLYERPVNRFVADFIGVSNFIPGTIASFDAATRTVAVDSERGLTLARLRHRPVAPARPSGDAVTVAIRPERPRGRPADGDVAAATGWTAVRGPSPPGHLPRRPDRVPRRRPTARASSIVRRQNAMGAGSGQGGPGDPVVVRWREEANLILVG